MRQVIFTGDDFGASLEVNEAIEQAHRNGVLSTASLMVGAQAAADAVQRAKHLPRLRVGLHLVVARGQATLGHRDLPAITAADGRFPDNLVQLGVKYFFSPAARRQLRAEIRAQFEAFRNSGLDLDHVNAHNHMHLHPTVLGLILSIGSGYGLRAVRLPYEPFLYSWRGAGDGFFRRLWPSILLAPWMRLMRAHLQWAGMQSNDYVFGMNESGHMQEAFILRLLARLPEGVCELYFHPATRRSDESDPRIRDYRPDEELSALLSPAIREQLRTLGIKMTTFHELVGASRTKRRADSNSS